MLTENGLCHEIVSWND